MMRALSRLKSSRSGATAIEFALVGPVFLMMIFGTFEVGLISLYSTMLDEGADAGATYMRDIRVFNKKTVYSDQDLRKAVCDAISATSMSCSEDQLKIAVYYAGEPITRPMNIPDIIENKSALWRGWGGSYVIAVAYEWRTYFPTTSLLMKTRGDRAQFQARTYAVPAERPTY